MKKEVDTMGLFGSGKKEKKKLKTLIEAIGIVGETAMAAYSLSKDEKIEFCRLQNSLTTSSETPGAKR